MTDALRSDRPGEAPDRERDARIEELLLAGLDHYFAGQYELAINVWTRVLFLDRGHARARAYIERARGAVSETQREGDELLHSGAAALSRGDRTAARHLLTAAMDRGTSGEEALALLHRLDLLEAASAEVGTQPSASSSGPAVADAEATPPGRDSRVAWMAGGIVAGILIAAFTGTYLWVVVDPFDLNASPTTLPVVAEDPLPVPAGCEIRLARARDLASKGRLHDALAELEPGDPDGRHSVAMDELRSTIQRQLLPPSGRATGSSPR